MKSTHPTRKRRQARHRQLQHERLEQRRLLAGMAFGGIETPMQPDTLDPVCIEMCPSAILKSSMEFTMAAAGDHSTGPVGDIYIPETIDLPGQRRNPRDFDPIPDSELGMSSPLPEEIDPSKLPGHGCPNGRAPDPPTFGTPGAYERSRQLNQYWEDQADSDVSCDGARMSPEAFENKWLNWYGPFESHDDCPTVPQGDDGGGSKGGGKDDGGGEGVEDKPVKDESGGQPPVKKDPEPEGGDPDEFRHEFVDQAIAFYGMSAGQGTSSSSGLPTRTTGERGEGLGFRVRQEARPGTEDGDPTERTSPVSSGAIDLALMTDYGAYPTPDDDGSGPSPRPEWGQAAMHVGAAHSTNLSGFAAGDSAYPTPDDDGGGPPLPPTA